MKIIITGATGFIGTHLCTSLSARHSVVPVVRRAKVTGNSQEFVIPDISESTEWAGVLAGADIIVHLAARAHVMDERSLNPLEEYRKVNTQGSIRLAEEAVKQGIKRFIYVSTVKVHGEGDSSVAYNSNSPLSATDPYGRSKAEAERALQKIAGNSDMELVILRPPAVYGLGVKGNIPKLARLIKTRIPLPFGSATNSRSMVSISNLEVWVKRAVEDELRKETVAIIGDPSPVALKDLVEWVGNGMQKRAILVPVPVSIMNFCARVLRKEAIAQRLFGSFVATPTFGAFPGIEQELFQTKDQLINFGVDFENSIN